MTLPEIPLQMMYARFAWGVVLAALVLAVLPLPSARRRGDAVVLSFVLMALPGPASPAFWLGLVFQQPSGLLATLCASAVGLRFVARPGQQVLPWRLALALALGGAVLYADAVGALGLGLYAWGFDAVQAPVVAIVLSVLSLAVIVRGRQVWAGWAVLLALTLHAVTHLPTGNFFDALLDPLLWLWAVWRCGAAAFAALRSRRSAAANTVS